MKTKIPQSTPHPIDELFTALANCEESGPLTVSLCDISRDPKFLLELFKRGRKNKRTGTGTGKAVLRVVLN